MDPFIALKNKNTRTLHINPFVKESTKAISNLGQMMSYVTLHLSSQFWTHMFFILIVHDYTRIIQWDCGSAVITVPIPFNEEHYLFDFFIHYNYTKSDMQGSDSSVQAPETEELNTATHLINEFCNSSSDREEANNFLVISILSSGEHVNDNYVIEAPFATISLPTGHVTRTFITYNIHRDKCIFLKDSWRIDISGMPKKGETYIKLQDKDIPYIAHCLNLGDIGDNTYYRT